MATALVQEVPHEYLGVALFVLVAVHALQHRRWFAALGKGRYNAVRTIQLIVLIILVLCLLGQVVSALVLSEHAFAFLPALPGASWARQVHMLCSYWAFLLAFAHVGLQFKNVLAKTGAMRGMPVAGIWALRAVWLAVAVLGCVSFVQLNLAGYLFARVQFAAVNLEVPLVAVSAQYAAVGVLVAGVFHYIRVALDKQGRFPTGGA